MSELTARRRIISLGCLAAIGGSILTGCGESSSNDMPKLAQPGSILSCQLKDGADWQTFKQANLGPEGKTELPPYFDTSLSQLEKAAKVGLVTCKTSLRDSIVSSTPVPATVESGSDVKDNNCVIWLALYGSEGAANNDDLTNFFQVVCDEKPQTV